MATSQKDELLPFESAEVEKIEQEIARQIADGKRLGREASMYGLSLRVRREIVRRRKVPVREEGTALIFKI